MASFRERIDALKEAGLADLKILEIMTDSVDGQPNTKTSLNNNKSGHELPKIDKNINAETPSVRKRRAGAFSAEKQPKSFRQGSPGLTWKREEFPLEHSFNRTLSPLTVSPNEFCFSANMDEASDLAERALNGEFPEFPKKSPLMASKNPKKHTESAKINKTSFSKKLKLYPK